MTVITEIARAKINLTLKVIGRRPDGYHALESLVVFADIADELALDTARLPGTSVSGPFAAAIEGANLIDTAVRLASQHQPRARLGHIDLIKRLPVAAGIGGGSADAAAALRAVARANRDLASEMDLAQIAARIGADVTVCLGSHAAMMWGVGERVADAGTLPLLPAVLVNHGAPLPTSSVFAALNAAPVKGALKDPEPPGPFAGIDDLTSYLRDKPNDLEAAALALAPAIRAVQAALLSCNGCLMARLSGSGPTCFGIFDSAASAADAAQTLSLNEPAWWVEATRLG